MPLPGCALLCYTSIPDTMKRLHFVFLLMLTCRICEGQNLIPNGNFETGPSGTSVGWQYLLTTACGIQNGTPGPTGWSVTSLTPDRKVEGTIYCNWDNDTAASGAAYIMLGNTESGKATLTQVLQVGAQYTLTYYLQMETLRGATYTSARIGFYFNNGGNTITSALVSNYTSWTSYTTTFTATAASTEIELRGLVSNAGMEIDNISLVKISTPLPVTLTQFNAKENNGTVLLDWETSSEINNDYFIVEKSLSPDVQTDNNATAQLTWESIGIITGAGNSTVTNNYSFTDESSIDATAYYRLKQVDYDGNFSYSPVRIIKRDTRNVHEVSIRPNPFKEAFTLTCSIKHDAPVSLVIFNTAGQIISTQHQQATKGANAFDFEASNLRQGVYLIQLVAGDEVQNLKVIRN
jgi:hypothetical protein